MIPSSHSMLNNICERYRVVKYNELLMIGDRESDNGLHIVTFGLWYRFGVIHFIPE